MANLRFLVWSEIRRELLASLLGCGTNGPQFDMHQRFDAAHDSTVFCIALYSVLSQPGRYGQLAVLGLE